MPKAKKVKPTLNQVQVIKRVKEQVEKGQKVSISKAMKGIYSDTTSLRPDKVTRTEGWQILMDKYFPDVKVAEIQAAVLTKKEFIVDRDEDGKALIQFTGQPHSDVQRALDSIHKLRGRHIPDEVPVKTVNYNLFYQPEIQEKVKFFEDDLKKMIAHEPNNY